MNRHTRFGSAISTLALAAVLSGCAAGQQKQESIFGSKVDRSNIGLATKAQAALASEQYQTAIDLAERAVANTPNDAGFRALLGNCYFASGRFASAEMAYGDSLSLIANQPKLIIKLALVQIGQGRGDEALTLLNGARSILDPSDYGLAVALAGQPAVAVEVLNEAARMSSADPRTRQNLALAYALSGDWTMARTVAAQDVPPEQLDERIHGWMAMAVPGQASEQVAALTGVRPVAGDPGQPQKLALNSTMQKRGEALAEVVLPEPKPATEPQPSYDIPESAPAALPAGTQVADASAPIIAEAARSLVQPAAEPMVEDTPAPSLEKAVAALPTRFDAPVKTASFVAISEKVRRAAQSQRRLHGRSNTVVQLGAYSSPERVSLAWATITKRYPALRDYTPMKARFDGPGGTVWRLSIKGFASRDEAADRCELLQSRGGKCFVRTVAGDAPVQLASR